MAIIDQARLRTVTANNTARRRRLPKSKICLAKTKTGKGIKTNGHNLFRTHL